MEKYSKKKISFAGPSITQKEIDSVMDAAKNGWYDDHSMHVRKLEAKICSYLGRKYAHATHCCTQALHTSTSALGLKAGDEVVCTDFSWVATAYSIVYTGAKPVFVDIEPDTWCISPDAVRKAITPKTKALMIVHSLGHPAEMKEIMEIVDGEGIKLIEDAAPSLGSKYHGRRTGTYGDFACFSFQGAKIAASGEGGIFVTDDQELYDKACLYTEMGRTDSKAVFWSDFVGYQYTMGNLPAAMALAQLERIDELVANKRRIFGWYHDRLKNVEEINLLVEKEGCFSNYSYPSLLLAKDTGVGRDKVIGELKRRNIHPRPAFPRMSRFPAHEARYPNPVCKDVEERGISLPAAHNMTEEDADFVVESLIEILGAKKR